jgi:hypothetical protein
LYNFWGAPHSVSTLDALDNVLPGTFQSVTVDFIAPDQIEAHLDTDSRTHTLYGEVRLNNQGRPVAVVRRLNKTPLLIFGSLLSRGVNRGFDQALLDADAELNAIVVDDNSITFDIVGAGAAEVIPPTPTPAPTDTPAPTPTPLPEYVDGEEVLFEDDFELGYASGWTYIDNPANWSVVEDRGNRVFRSDTVNSLDYSFVRVGTLAWQDYALEFRAMVVGSNLGTQRSDGSRLEANIRLDATRQGCRRYNIAIQDRALDLARHTWGSVESECPWQRLTDGSRPVLEEDRWYQFRIEAYGAKITIYLDDELEIQTEDTQTPMLTGQVQLGVAPGNIVHFDDVRVIELVPR